MNVALIGFLLLTQQVEGTCEPSGYSVQESDAVAAVRYFFDLGNRRDFAGVASFLVPGATGEVDGETVLLAEELNRNIAEGDTDLEPTYVLDTMSAPGAVAAKVSSGGESGIVVFQMAGTCIARATYFGD